MREMDGVENIRDIMTDLFNIIDEVAQDGCSKYCKYYASIKNDEDNDKVWKAHCEECPIGHIQFYSKA